MSLAVKLAIQRIDVAVAIAAFLLVAAIVIGAL